MSIAPYDYSNPQTTSSTGTSGFAKLKPYDYGATSPTTSTTPKSSLVSNIVNTVTSPFISAFKGAVSGFQNTPTTPKTVSPISTTFNTIGDAIVQGSKNLDQQVESINKNGLFSLKGAVAEGEIALNTIVNPLFKVALSPLQGLATIPGVGPVVDSVNKLFGAISGGAGAGATQVLNELPLSPETKKTLAPFVNDTAALVAQIYAGKASGEVISKLKDNTKAITSTISDAPEVKQLTVTHETPTEAPVKVSTPITKHTEYAKAQGYEPYTPPEKLPTIQMGPPAKGELPIIQTQVKTPPVKGDLTYEAIKPQMDRLTQPQTPPVAPENVPTRVSSPETQNTQPSINEAPQKANSAFAEKPIAIAPKTSNKGIPTKVASDINKILIKQGFDALPTEEQSKYTPQSYKEVADKVASLMDSNIEHAKAIATGDKPVPKNLNGQILFNTIEAYATKVGDGELLAKLASSPLGKKLSEAGQTLGGHGFNDNPNSAVRAIQEVQKVREASKNTAVKSATVNEIKRNIEKTAPTKQNWSEFIDSITC